MVTIKHKFSNKIVYGSEAAGGDAGKTYTGNTTTMYMHLSAPDLSIFQSKKVKAGQVIGYVGTTGNSTGDHLHFTFKIGRHQVHDDTAYDNLLAATYKVSTFITEDSEDWKFHSQRVIDLNSDIEDSESLADLEGSGEDANALTSCVDGFVKNDKGECVEADEAYVMPMGQSQT
jgi:murein DD-endopeptidase MepM/ murein hydrolase activator NlpD